MWLLYLLACTGPSDDKDAPNETPDRARAWSRTITVPGAVPFLLEPITGTVTELENGEWAYAYLTDTRDELIVIRLDREANPIWSVEITGESNLFPTAITDDGDRFMVTAGRLGDDFTTVIELDPDDGTLTSAFQIDGISEGRGAATPDKGLLIAGSAIAALDTNRNISWTLNHSAQQALVLDSSYAFVSGDNSGAEWLVTEFDGTFVFAGGAAPDQSLYTLAGAAVLDDSSVAVAMGADFGGSSDVALHPLVVVAFDPATGDVLWSTSAEDLIIDELPHAFGIGSGATTSGDEIFVGLEVGTGSVGVASIGHVIATLDATGRVQQAEVSGLWPVTSQGTLISVDPTASGFAVTGSIQDDTCADVVPMSTVEHLVDGSYSEVDPGPASTVPAVVTLDTLVATAIDVDASDVTTCE